MGMAQRRGQRHGRGHGWALLSPAQLEAVDQALELFGLVCQELGSGGRSSVWADACCTIWAIYATALFMCPMPGIVPGRWP